MPEENRVFDVTKPSHVNPSATSRPVIVGHQPTMNDPMVREGGEPTRIQVNDDSERQAFTPEPAPEPELSEPPKDFGAPGLFSSSGRESSSDQPYPHSSLGQSDPPAAIYHPPENTTTTADNIEPIDDTQFNRPHRKKRKWPKMVLALLVLAIAAYLLIDAGVFGSGINLPVHIFKQKQKNTASNTPPPASNAATTPSVPAGFKEYKLAGTNLTFAAPTAWGDPTSSTDPGYSQRGGTNQSDGTYAYLVNFATNKDVQIAVTSSKFLPTARATLYYDYLQWCTGTNDGKIYESILHFTTANKINTPTTITCDQGPVPSVVQVDSTTILQPKAVDTSGKTIGDIYTKNLTDPSLVVFRVKDAAMTNGTDIKTLLTTVNVGQSASSPSGNSSQ